MSGSSSDEEVSLNPALDDAGNIEAAYIPEAVHGVVPLHITMAGSGATSGPHVVEAEGNAVGKEYIENLGSDFRVPFSLQYVNLGMLVREFNLPNQFEYLSPREGDSACTPSWLYYRVHPHAKG